MEKLKKNEKLLCFVKTVCIFIVYFLYTHVFSTIFNAVGFTDDTAIMFIADIIFLFGIILVYKKNLKEDFMRFKKDYKWPKKITTVLKWVVILFVVNMVMGMVTEMLFPTSGDGASENTTILYSLSLWYTIFKTLIFASVAEELLFKETVRDLINNKVVFIVISTLLYVFANIMYADFASEFIWVDILMYLMFGFVTSLAYIKNNSNIVVLIFIKFFYNLIPVTLLILSAILPGLGA